jgi:hypothetical protein
MPPTTLFHKPITPLTVTPVPSETVIAIEHHIAEKLFQLYLADDVPGMSFAQWLNRELDDLANGVTPFEKLYGIGATPWEMHRD